MRIIKKTDSRQRVVKWDPIELPRELLLAGRRIGESPTKRMKWLLAFAYMNLDDLSEGQRSDLAWDVKAFMLPPNIAEPRTDLSVLLALNRVFVVNREEISDRTLQTFQEFARSGLQAAFFEGGWEFTHPKRTEKISLGLKAGEKSWPGGSGQFDIPSLKEIFETTSFDLVKAEMGRLGICGNPRCGKPFVTEKKGKGQFCSPRCSAYVRIARFRGKELTVRNEEAD